MKPVQKYPFLLFWKNTDLSLISAFLLRFKANYLEKMRGPWRDLLFSRGPNLARKPFYLVRTVLKSDKDYHVHLSF